MMRFVLDGGDKVLSHSEAPFTTDKAFPAVHTSYLLLLTSGMRLMIGFSGCHILGMCTQPIAQPRHDPDRFAFVNSNLEIVHAQSPAQDSRFQ
jgi:hypothetical protein